MPEADEVQVDRLIKFFHYGHLPPHLQKVSQQFYDLATWINARVAAGPERSVALRKLLEAKDAAVRACVYPEG